MADCHSVVLELDEECMSIRKELMDQEDEAQDAWEKPS